MPPPKRTNPKPRIILDYDVAALYGVETREINQAVKNNPEKFPDGYIIEIEKQEFINLRSIFLIANNHKSRVLPKTFTDIPLNAKAISKQGKRDE